MYKILTLLLSAQLFAATPILDVSAVTIWYEKVEPGSSAKVITDIRAYLTEKGNPDVLRDARGRVQQPDALAARWNESQSVDTVLSLLRQCPTADEKCALVELGLVRRTLIENATKYIVHIEG